MSTTETIPDFAKRTGLPEKLLRLMVRQGQLPIIRVGSSRPKIHIEAALEKLKEHAEETAAEIAATLPVPIKIFVREKPKTNDTRKYKGRPPDKVRLANRG